MPKIFYGRIFKNHTRGFLQKKKKKKKKKKKMGKKGTLIAPTDI
jgi:hypothetical protein